ncbi:ATPase / Transcriptional regulator, LuxR family [Leucobacter sp. 7(1)]|uniref:helix-turn-helix transcriptional regulator n=1 Tax=Leucobacter sp. 7(1) TaxID=1255613 RepID=UPI00097ECBF1|nr:helix-turn-helix transcriptional regulator [Leucobacter sp. 7(1)]SJN13449.1 ATPase / Transcriptional regulator, LuxR family [Leucobacter sp. 7(1)]
MQADLGSPDLGPPELAARFARQQASIAAAVPDRLERIVVDLAAPGAIVLLVGEGGTGRLALAREAASLVATHQGESTVIELPQPPHETSGVASVFAEVADAGGGDAGDTAAVAARILAGMVASAASGEVMLVAPSIDGYSPRDTRVLELLFRDARVRAVATARQLTTGVEQLSSGPGRSRISVAPLDLAQADAYLSELLGVDRIEAETLRRWVDAAGGNSYALTVLALSSESAGTLRRSRGAAWSTAVSDEVPSGYARVLMGTSTPAELEVLELVALAEPVTETALLRSMDAACVSVLFERGLLMSKPSSEGSSLVAGHPLLASLLRAGMSPVRRIQLNDQIFRLLSEDLGAVDPVYAPDRLMRLVVFGLEGGHVLPFPWLWAAFEQTVRGGDPRLVLNLALAVTAHAGADAGQAATAALRAYRISRLLGDAGTLRPLLGMMRALLADPTRCDALTPMLRIRLQSTLIEQEIWDDGDCDVALAAIANLEAQAAAEDGPVQEAVRSARVQILAYAGRLRDAGLAAPGPDVSSDLKTEWVRSPARAIHTLILDQQGAFERALASAENTRQLSRLGPRARPDFVDMHSFGWLMGFWVSGSAESARQVLDELTTEVHTDTHAEARYTGLVEAGAVLISVQEGRWADAAQTAELLLERLDRHDSYGVAPLVQAALAHALAVLGERDSALRALHSAAAPTRGMGQVLAGTRRLLALRARQWLRLPDTVAEAQRVLTWAGEEELPLIELLALHVLATEARAASPEFVERARRAAAEVDPPLSGAFLAHIERIAQGPGAAATHSDEPEVRMLAGLGVWLPLPPAADLTAREREIALLAALGHSSKFIAERLHISARTVETHLSNIFAKTGVENRDELGRWAARDRAPHLGVDAP